MSSCTVFVGTYDRTSTLETTIKSYERFGSDVEVVIVDNGSENVAAQQMLLELAHLPQVRRVYHKRKARSMDEAAANFLAAIDEENSKADWVAISEADISFDETNAGAIDACVEVARVTQRAAGVHLRVDAGIPTGYPLRSRVLATEARLVYRKAMSYTSGIPYSSCQTDTTFHLWPRERVWKRLHMDPLRVGEPFCAKHLDWYLDIDRPTAENAIYVTDEGEDGFGSWGRKWIGAWWNRYLAGPPEQAYRYLFSERCTIGDICNRCCMLSWCAQYGRGREANEADAVKFLRAAIPTPHPYYDANSADWMELVFGGPEAFRALGWDS